MITTNGETRVRVKLAVREVLGTTFRGGAVFTGTTEDDVALRVVATPEVLPRCPAVGEVWIVAGEVEHHARYGEQFLASECRYAVPTGRLLIRYLADNPAFEGIGEGKAKALWAAFGDRLVPTLTSGDARALETVLTPSMAEKLVTAWLSKAAEVDLMAFLDAHGFDLRLAAKLNRVWGDRARDMLDANPYYLLAFASWKPVDLAAARLGVAKDDSRRLVGAVESALYDRLQRGHTLTEKPRLVRLTSRKLGGRGANEAVKLALEALAITGSDSTGFQTSGAAALEAGIEDRLRAILKGETPGQAPLFSAQRGKDWAKPLIVSVEQKQRFNFNEAQREAILMPFSHNFSLLTGGAGVGKTAVLRAIIKLAERQHLRIFQMALAGRAAKRMSESTGFPSM
jgi:exodeoxyribonuclease V alpha subunit